MPSVGCGQSVDLASSVSAPNVLEGPQRHLVRPEMLIATAKMTDVVAPAFRAQATDDSYYDIAELTGDGPVVLVFIKEGCPCSLAAQPFFNLLFDAYGKHARFFKASSMVAYRVAKKWDSRKTKQRPLLSDPTADRPRIQS